MTATASPSEKLPEPSNFGGMIEANIKTLRQTKQRLMVFMVRASSLVKILRLVQVVTECS
jgi:hypothetical protein